MLFFYLFFTEINPATVYVREPRGIRTPSSLKAVFSACLGKSLLEVRPVRLRKSSSQLSKKCGFKVLRILTAINLEKSRQTNAITCG